MALLRPGSSLQPTIQDNDGLAAGLVGSPSCASAADMRTAAGAGGASSDAPEGSAFGRQPSLRGDTSSRGYPASSCLSPSPGGSLGPSRGPTPVAELDLDLDLDPEALARAQLMAQHLLHAEDLTAEEWARKGLPMVGEGGGGGGLWGVWVRAGAEKRERGQRTGSRTM